MTGRVPYRDIPGRNGNLLRLGVTVPTDNTVAMAVHPTDTDGDPINYRALVVTLDAAGVLALIGDLVQRVAVLTAPLAPHQLQLAPEWQNNRPATTPNDRKVGRR